MHEVFAAFPPCDEAVRVNLKKAPAADVRKIYLQVRGALCQRCRKRCIFRRLKNN
jgi:hypothetical protein